MGLDFEAVKGVVFGLVAFFVLGVFWVAFFPIAEASGMPLLHIQMIQLAITVFLIGVVMNFLKRSLFNNNNSSEGYGFS